MDSLAARIASASSTVDASSSTGFPSRAFIKKHGDANIGVIGNIELRSIYQPILSPMLMRIVGMEVLPDICESGKAVEPGHFWTAIDPHDQAGIHQLSLSLHMRNAPTLQQGDEWIFMPLHAATIRRHADDLVAAQRLLSELQMDPARIVLDIRESHQIEDTELDRCMKAYRETGFRVALDSSNYDRVLALCPDIVRLDHSLIRNAETSSWNRRLFPHVTSQLQESGSLVLVDGITTETQAHIAIDANAELLQGEWLAPSAPALPGADLIAEKAKTLAGMTPTDAAARSDTHLRSCFMTVWNAYHGGRELEEIVTEIREAQVTRIYVIDSSGFQIGATALTANALRGRQHPLANATGACWARRHYFRNAMAHPGRVQVTSPYLSLTEQRLCVTYSCMVMRASKQVVLCMDALLG